MCESSTPVKIRIEQIKVIVYLRFTVSTEILSMHSHSQVNHLHLVTYMCPVGVQCEVCILVANGINL